MWFWLSEPLVCGLWHENEGKFTMQKFLPLLTLLDIEFKTPAFFWSTQLHSKFKMHNFICTPSVDPPSSSSFPLLHPFISHPFLLQVLYFLFICSLQPSNPPSGSTFHSQNACVSLYVQPLAYMDGDYRHLLLPVSLASSCPFPCSFTSFFLSTPSSRRRVLTQNIASPPPCTDTAWPVAFLQDFFLIQDSSIFGLVSPMFFWFQFGIQVSHYMSIPALTDVTVGQYVLKTGSIHVNKMLGACAYVLIQLHACGTHDTSWDWFNAKALLQDIAMKINYLQTPRQWCAPVLDVLYFSIWHFIPF